MTAIANAETDALYEAGDFFAPASSDLIDGLVAEYRSMRAKIEKVADLFEGDISGTVHYFIEGNRCTDGSRYSSLSAEKIFQRKGAVAALDASYWQRAMSMTDVYNCMPQARRDEWNKSIREMTAPEFTEETVRATLGELLLSRQRFFAERIDGIFRALSREHVTNSPEGFGKRMILRWVLNAYSHVNHSEAGYINDLRAVIAKFMGRDEPRWNSTSAIVDAARHRSGQWVMIDGGALRLRVYKKGTGHLEIHPDMAWRLNAVLASLYPAAIPSRFRTKPAKTPKEWKAIQRPLPFAVLDLLSRLQKAWLFEKTDDFSKPYNRIEIPNACEFEHFPAEQAGKQVLAEAERVLESIGGVKQQKGHFLFPYNPSDVLHEITTSGCIPCQQSHQFYPTPVSVAEIALEMAQIGADDLCLEPSAGLGGLADNLPKDRTTCVELAPMHCRVLEAKGFKTVEGDFLKWSPASHFDRIVMNPPFSEGRWQAHLQHAAKMVSPGGRIVAILPASANRKDLLPGWTQEWSGIIVNEFAGTSVSVVILAATRPV